MSEFQTTIATTSSVPAAVVAKPRISADAFRNLTARLKKPDVEVPSLSPVAVPVVVAATPAVQIDPLVVQAPIVLEPVQITVAPIELSPVAPVEDQSIEILPVQDFEPAPLVQFEELPQISALLPEPTAPVSVEALPTFQDVFPDVVQPLAVETLPQVIEVYPELQPSVFVEGLPQSIELVPEIEVATSQFPPLPEFVPEPQAASVEVAPTVQPVEEINFAENFTYVPAPGEADAPPQIQLDEESRQQEVAQRAAELELENIWRLMLAKPTSDDRIAYLREADEIHAADAEWNKPEPEHDLSRIEPMFVPEAPELEIAVQAQPAYTTPTAVINIVNVPEGQDIAELTRSLLDMMAAGNASGLPQERALAADTLLRLLPKLELKPLMLVAQRLAMMDQPPNLLVSKLIRDARVEVAGPLLEDCVHITDKDLEQIIEEGDLDKLRMIGRRRKLSRPISDALIKSGEPSVVLTLVRNMEAEISHSGFESLLILCENQQELLAPLATRQDLAAPFAFEMFWLAPAQLRRFILSRFLTDSETLTKILKITKMANADDEGEQEPLSQFVLLEALERAARGHVDVAAEELSNIMQLSASTIARILNDTQGEALIVMLKVAAYPRSSLPGLLKRLQESDIPLISREREISDLQSMFETLSFNKARILLTYWNWAQSKTGPYAPVH